MDTVLLWGENDEVGRQNTDLSKLSTTLRNLLSTFWTGSLGRNPGSVGNFQVESWRGSCEEPLWLVHKWDWNMEEGQLMHQFVSPHRSLLGSFEE